MAVTPTGYPGTSSATPMEAHLRAIVETQPVCLIRVAADGTLCAVNEAARSMLGCESLAQALGQNLSDFLPVDQRNVFCSFIGRVASGARESLEVSLTNLQQRQFTVELRGVPLANAPDDIRSALVVFRDMSEQRRLEQSLMDGVARCSGPPASGDTEPAALATDEDSVWTTRLESVLKEADDRLLQAADAHAAEVARLIDERAAAVAAQHARVAELERQMEESGARCREWKALEESRAREAAELMVRLSELQADHENVRQELTVRAQEIASLMAELNEKALRDESAAESAQRQVLEADLSWTSGVAYRESLGDVLRGELAAAMARIFQQAATSLETRHGCDSQQQAENLRAVAHVAESMAGLLGDRQA